ncbi:MAG TPA: DUF1365 domain-containing protein [Thermoleophilaceae bacterium]|nr:DUF1365 domain-containing protein [Thermoleophilaceae bacterium]
MSASALYEGTVRHRRVAVRAREFRYSIYMAYIDLEELPGLLRGRLVSARPGVVRFRRSDYLGDPREDLATAARERVHELTGRRPEGPVRLLTNLRSFGHCFNPVSFYYCFDRPGERVEAVLAEVTNTPWGDRHAYALSHSNGGRVLSGRSGKALHVSPFMGMDHEYEWRVSVPGETLSVHIESHRAGARAFDATLNLARRELTSRSLASATARHPMNTLHVLARIYGQALRLKLEGVPVHPNPGAPR